MSPHAPLATSLAASPPPVAKTRKSTCGLWANRRASCHWQATPRLSRASHSRPARTRSCPAPRQAPWKCGTWRWASRCATCSATSRRSRASSTTTTPTTSRPARLTRRFACGIWGARAVSSRTKATRAVWMAFASGEQLGVSSEWVSVGDWQLGSHGALLGLGEDGVGFDESPVARRHQEDSFWEPWQVLFRRVAGLLAVGVVGAEWVLWFRVLSVEADRWHGY